MIWSQKASVLICVLTVILKLQVRTSNPHPLARGQESVCKMMEFALQKLFKHLAVSHHQAFIQRIPPAWNISPLLPLWKVVFLVLQALLPSRRHHYQTSSLQELHFTSLHLHFKSFSLGPHITLHLSLPLLQHFTTHSRHSKNHYDNSKLTHLGSN